MIFAHRGVFDDDRRKNITHTRSKEARSSKDYEKSECYCELPKDRAALLVTRDLTAVLS